MQSVIVVGEVLRDISLSSPRQNKFFCYIDIKTNDLVLRLYATDNEAILVNEKIKKGMIVNVSCRLRYSKFSRYKDTFNLMVIDFTIVLENKDHYKMAEKEKRGANGKLLPF